MNDNLIFQVPGLIKSDRSMSDGGRQFVVYTYENLSPEKLRRLIELEGKPGWFTFNVEIIEAQDIVNLPKLDSADFPQGKTPIRRQHDVIYVLWEQKGKQGKFIDFYIKCIERFIEQVKNQLEPTKVE